MFTPGRCTNAISWFWRAGAVWRVRLPPPVRAAGATWGEASTGAEAGGSGQAGTEKDAGYGAGILGAARIGATGEDCTVAVVSSVCVIVFSPAEGRMRYASAATPNAATTAMPTISI